MPGKCFATFSLAESTSLGCRTEMFLAGVVAGVVSVLQHAREGRIDRSLALFKDSVLLAKAALLEGRLVVWELLIAMAH